MSKKLIYGIAYNSKGKHKAAENGKITNAYDTWRAMMRRCYDVKAQEKHPTYLDCSVDERFHDFQDFADWFYDNPYSNLGYHLDKDLLFPSNKIYSPETCCFVPQELNSLLTDHRSARGDLPQGVCLHKSSGKFRARVGVDGKRRSLGCFDCPNEAYQTYKSAKERYVKNKALEWANRIEWNVFVALMNWTLDSNNEPC